MSLSAAVDIRDGVERSSPSVVLPSQSVGEGAPRSRPRSGILWAGSSPLPPP